MSHLENSVPGSLPSHGGNSRGDSLIQMEVHLEAGHAERVSSSQRGAWLPLVFAGCAGFVFLDILHGSLTHLLDITKN